MLNYRKWSFQNIFRTFQNILHGLEKIDCKEFMDRYSQIRALLYWNFFLECSLFYLKKGPIIQQTFIHIWKWSFYLRYLKQFKNWNNIPSNTKEKIPLLLEFQLRWIRSRINDHAQCYKGNTLLFFVRRF